jgi:hypothetical protein
LSDRPLVKVSFSPDKFESFLGTVESMWAEHVDGLQFRLENIPISVYGVSLGDVVEVELAGGLFWVHSIASRSGHSTCRLLLEPGSEEESRDFVERWRQLEALGCAYESRDLRHIAVDVPPQTQLESVLVVLAAGEREGSWRFELAHRGHDESG